ncbi:type II toxin-antitoxin system VapC family toxin [Pseudokineococcus basanitobsidens]|uniref:Ribonuclease VapC n=1 Tax=Pseudokineococcus basanitobsidens TaxID=1926649 RepID=A0ABU8RF40_9ACTN
MILDTSAVVAVLRGEPDAEDHLAAMSRADVLRISAATLVELSVVVDARRDPVLSRRLDELLDALDVVVEPFTATHAAVARDAYRDYGKGSGHPAGLNLGDCFSYALASVTGEALLFTGDDFGETDLRPALDETSA